MGQVILSQEMIDEHVFCWARQMIASSMASYGDLTDKMEEIREITRQIDKINKRLHGAAEPEPEPKDEAKSEKRFFEPVDENDKIGDPICRNCGKSWAYHYGNDCQRR